MIVDDHKTMGGDRFPKVEIQGLPLMLTQRHDHACLRWGIQMFDGAAENVFQFFKILIEVEVILVVLVRTGS